MTSLERAAGKRDWMHRKERGSPILIRFIAWLAVTVGRKPTRLLLHPIALYFLLCAPRQRRQSQAFLNRVLDRSARLRDSYRHFLCFASTILDRIYFLTNKGEALSIEFQGLDALDAVCEQGRGAVMIGAHFGSFDAMRALAIGRPEFTLKILMHIGSESRVAATIHALNPELEEMIIPLGQSGSMLRVNESLKRGEWVGVLADRVVMDGKTRSVSFLGQDADFPISPWILAAVSKVPVLMFAGVYLGGNRYQIKFKLLSEGGIQDRGHRETAFQGEIDSYVETLEDWVRAHPYNWFNFYDFWA
ncbi:MAG: lipid A biosynthesis acyltransferase [Alphaproteobacteria bacterium]|nr:lipid A biosynthesis acyltransferase [Alphaproteobacteria bacterium]